MAPADYVSIASTRVVIPAAETTLTFPVTVKGDNIDEGNESLFLRLRDVASVGPAPSFAIPATFSLGSLAVVDGHRPVGAATGDLNGDGKLDVVVTARNYDDILVLLNTTVAGATTPSFSAATPFESGDGAFGVALADFNDDGRVDIAATYYVQLTNAHFVAVMLNTTNIGAATPTFAPAASYPVDGANGLAIADLNADGKPDIAVSGPGGAYVLLNATSPGASAASFGAATHLPTGNLTTSVAAGDLNGDGKTDLVLANYFEGNIAVLLNNTAPAASIPTFSSVQTFEAGGGAVENVAVVELNADGRLDIAAGVNHLESEPDSPPNHVAVLLNATAPGSPVVFRSATSFFGLGDCFTDAIVTGDVNGDERPDVLVSGPCGFFSYINTTAVGSIQADFDDPIAEWADGWFYSLDLADLNNDGRLDVVTANGQGSPSVFDPDNYYDSLWVVTNSTPGPAGAPAETYSVGLTADHGTGTIIDDDGAVTPPNADPSTSSSGGGLGWLEILAAMLALLVRLVRLRVPLDLRRGPTEALS